MTAPPIAISEPAGSDGRPLLVLGPSLGTSSLVWEPALPLLREHFRVQTWDLPGHGRSPATTRQFSTTDLARSVLDAVAEPTFVYAGVSLGGAVGLELSLLAPERITAASTVCSAAKIGTVDGWLERARVVRTQGTASLIVAAAERWFAPGFLEREPKLSGRLLHNLRDADDESYALCADALASYDVRGKLSSIASPVRALWGATDAVTTEANSLEIASGVRTGSATRVDAAAHLASAEQPAAVTAALIEHFTNAEGAR
jgi:3-oxoadipate enol-lactonase